MNERYTKPLLLDRLDGPGVVTLNLDLGAYHKAREVMDAGYRFAIRARPKYRFELTVRNADDQPISLATSGDLGLELHAAAETLIDQAFGVLFDPLPW